MTDEYTLRHITGFHLLYVALGALLYSLDALTVGQATWVVVVAYNVSLPTYFFQRGNLEVVALWAFLLPLSFLQLIPDWYLADIQQTLAFPTATGPLPVPLFMAGLWTFPLVLTTVTGLNFHRRKGPLAGYASAIAAGILVFGGGELVLTDIGVWRADQVLEIGGLAVYILPAELLLVAATLYAYENVEWQSPWTRISAAPIIMLAYLGAATTSYLLVDAAARL